MTKLDLSGCPVRDVTVLAKLKNLRTLKLNDTLVSDLSSLSGLPIETLELANSTIADITPLRNLQKLISLDLSKTAVTDITALQGAFNLLELKLSHTNVADLKPLSELTGLESLQLAHVPATDFLSLANLGLLQYLDLSHTTFRSTEILSRMALRELNLAHTVIDDIGALSAQRDLNVVNLNDTNVQDISPIAKSELTHLHLANTHITDLEILNGRELEVLNLDGLSLTHWPSVAVACDDLTINCENLELSAFQFDEYMDRLRLINVKPDQGFDWLPAGLNSLEIESESGILDVVSITKLKWLTKLRLPQGTKYSRADFENMNGLETFYVGDELVFDRSRPNVWSQ